MKPFSLSIVSEESQAGLPLSASKPAILAVTGTYVAPEAPSKRILSMFGEFLNNDGTFSEEKTYAYVDKLVPNQQIHFPTDFRQFRDFAVRCLRTAFEHRSNFREIYPQCSDADFLTVQQFLLDDVWKNQVVRGRSSAAAA